jgi:TonB-dependent SusC/RagA subfamily outer membrane receptor
MHVGSQAPRLAHATSALTLLLAAATGCGPLAQTGGRPTVEPTPIHVGYGTAKRSRIISSVASIDSTVIERRQVQSLEEALRGLPGVEVIGRGVDVRVRIRGTSSFIGTNDPLYVIDGIPLTFGMAQPLSGINPHDVARIDVLKDAAATIYGVRGANGVVLITTKRAR